MKKIIALCLLTAAILICGTPLEAKSTNSQVIEKCEINSKEFYISSFSFLADGHVKTNDVCFEGSYEKRDDGRYYLVVLCALCADGCDTILLTDNEIYLIDRGSDTCLIDDFIYYPDKHSIHVLLDSSCDEAEWIERNAYWGVTSLDIPLSRFKKLGTYKFQ